MKLFYATKNKFKINNMKNRICDLDIVMYTPYDFDFDIDVEENGKSVLENAKIKAMAYSDKVDMPIVAADSSLYVEKFEKQPGLFVHRVDGLSNDEIEDFYIRELNKVGGSSKAYFVTGLALIVNGECKTIEIKEDEFLFTSDKYDGPKGFDDLGRLEYDIKLNKYFCELSDKEMKNRGYTFDFEVINFLKNSL